MPFRVKTNRGYVKHTYSYHNKTLTDKVELAKIFSRRNDAYHCARTWYSQSRPSKYGGFVFIDGVPLETEVEEF